MMDCMHKEAVHSSERRLLLRCCSGFIGALGWRKASSSEYEDVTRAKHAKVYVTHDQVAIDVSSFTEQATADCSIVLLGNIVKTAPRKYFFVPVVGYSVDLRRGYSITRAYTITITGKKPHKNSRSG